MPAANSGSDSAAASRVPSAVGVEEDAEPDEAVPTNDDEDEMMFPELVDVASQQAVDDEYMEEPISQARFDDTDDEDKVENMDSLIEDEYDGDDMPTIEWNREKTELSVGKRTEDEMYSIWQWQIRGKPCIHALHLMTVIGSADGEVDQYCSEYFSVAKFMVTYADNVPALLGKDQWNIVDPGFKLHAPVITRPPRRPRNQRIRAGEEGRLPKKRACKKCGVLGHIARLCTNAVDASFGEEERWTAANAEENAAAMETEDAVENAAANEAVENAAENEASCSREKRPRDEEAEDFETMAFDGFEAIREEEEGVIFPIVPLKITEPIDDRQMVVKCSASGTTPSAPPRGKPQVKPKIKRNKSLKEKSISTRETRSKTVKPAANTRSKSKI
nr:uncharacterized protein LOC120962420 [Aegilops tauschii subsp. strangulata]